jgi:hypothetical protein
MDPHLTNADFAVRKQWSKRVAAVSTDVDSEADSVGCRSFLWLARGNVLYIGFAFVSDRRKGLLNSGVASWSRGTNRKGTILAIVNMA